MRLLSVEIIGHKRLCFKQLDRLYIDFTSREQLILGRNGSGKSVLMTELSPLPAEQNNYRADGKKVQIVEHMGDVYTLTSDFSKKNIHSFILSGEEMNEGGTITVQRELVKYHFNYGRDTMSILMGEKPFTKMGPQERRMMFIAIAENNMYALTEYQRYKSLNSQAASGATFLKRKLATEMEKRHTPEETQALEKTVTELQNRLSHWVNLRQKLNIVPEHLKTALDGSINAMDALSRKFLETAHIVPKHDLALKDLLEPIGEITPESLRQYIEQTDHVITAQQSLFNKDVEDFDKLDASIALLTKMGQTDQAALAQEIQVLQGEHDQILNRRRFKFDLADATVAMNALNACQDTLTYVAQELPVNDDMKYGRVALEALEKEIEKYAINLRKLDQHLKDNEARLAHLDQHMNAPEVQCPECSHTFRLVPREHDEFKRLTEETPRVRALITERSATKAELDEKAEKCRQYIMTYRQYAQCAKSWPILDAFWSMLDQQKSLLHEPGNLMQYVHQFRGDIRLAQDAEQILVQIEKKRQLLKQSETIQNGSLDDQVKRQTQIQTQISVRQAQLVILKQHRQQFKQYEQRTQQGLLDKAQYLKAREQFDQQFFDWAEAEWQDFIREEIALTSDELAIKQKQLTEQQHHARLVAELEGQIEQADAEAEATRFIMEALSPTDGLIAEGLMGFINHFVAQMNQFLARVWTYPLVIQPCAVDENNEVDLDYRFPVMVDNDDNLIDDVAVGSKAMKAIFNLAFIVVYMQYSGLSDSPLYLDEFGEGFDDAHRFESISAIQALMEQYPFTQLFMISHYEMTYSAFSDAQVFVLDKTNITLPSGCVYNEHAQLTMVV